ncbi:MAG: glutathione S-transferase N-terminal domain-containing protein [Granulosicoccaceae bacterium]
MVTAIARRSVMTLFSVPSDMHSHRVRVVLSEKDIVVEVEDVDPDYLPEDLQHLNPYNTVPTLVDRDLVLYDSRVIAEYLDERFPHPPLMPVDPVSRARTRLALFRVENDWYPLAHTLENGSEKKRTEARKLMRESLVASAEIFELKPFFLSDEFSLVDATIAPLLWRLPKYGVDLPKETKPIQDYADRMFKRSGFVESLTEVEREMR